MDRQQIAMALRRARHNANMTCKEVADILGNTHKAVSAWEHCNGQPDIGILVRLCEVYNLSGVDELLSYFPRKADFQSLDKFEFDNLILNSLRTEEKELLTAYRNLSDDKKQAILTILQVGSNQNYNTNDIATTQEDTNPTHTFDLPTHDLFERINFIKVFNQSDITEYDFISNIRNIRFEKVAVPYVPPSADFGVRISEDAMQPTVNYGDIVFVERKANIDINDLGIFIVDGRTLCRKLIYRDNMCYLHATSIKYGAIPFNNNYHKTIGRIVDKTNE